MSRYHLSSQALLIEGTSCNNWHYRGSIFNNDASSITLRGFPPNVAVATCSKIPPLKLDGLRMNDFVWFWLYRAGMLLTQWRQTYKIMGIFVLSWSNFHHHVFAMTFCSFWSGSGAPFHGWSPASPETPSSLSRRNSRNTENTVASTSHHVSNKKPNWRQITTLSR